MDLVELAWMVINHWIKADYGGDRQAAIEELGDLDNCAIRVADCIEAEGLADSDVDVIFLAAGVELAGCG